MVLVPPLSQVERMFTPGAMISIMVPKLEKDAKRSELSEAATVKTLASEAGDEVEASAASLPAATDMKTPAATALAAAELTAVEREPPRDILPTAPFGQLRDFASLAT